MDYKSVIRPSPSRFPLLPTLYVNDLAKGNGWSLSPFNFLEIDMNAKQLFSVAALLAVSSVAMAQAPAAEKPAGTVSQNAGAETKSRTDKMQAQPDAKKSRSTAHDHKEDGPKKTIYSGA
ncbi:hypothetical protein [Collimonas sp.]|uniref:hypothetical protein n=1 Tax=Collimonas sp. TaxID=1963772 RepID=UPI002C93F26D|nr:hypothetical protein [Collimonas sp.]HWW99648.1 hypothetical protein [Collimonas sp.]